jgi:hypothetical protein
MRADAERYYASNRGIATLLGGLLLPPSAWILHLELSFTYAVQLCSGQHLWLPHVTTLLALAVTVAAGLMARRNWHGTGGRLNEDRGGVIARSNFLAVAGMASAIFFGWVILATEVPNLFMSPCQ